MFAIANIFIHLRTTAGVHARVALDDVIGGRTSLRVLRVLALYPEKAFTGRELAHMAESAPSRVNLELERLKVFGVVSRVTHGRTHVWRARRDHEILRMLTPAFEREHALPTIIEEALRAGVDDRRISRAILFGSFARGDETATSDVDLLVVVARKGDVEPVRSVLDDLSIRMSERFGSRLAPIIHAEAELPRLRRTALFKNIAAEGRVLRGPPL